MRFYSKTVATIFFYALVKTQEGDKLDEKKYSNTMTAIKQAGNWQLVISHQSEFPEAREVKTR